MEIRNDTADVLAQLIADQSDRNSDDRVQLTGEVLGTDSDGTVWVHIFGGEERTPVTSTNVVVRKGDVVYVMIGDGRADILGNVSRPSTDDTTAIMVDRRVDVISERVHTIETDYVVADDIRATTAYIEHLTANDVTAEEIVADHAEVGSLDANYAQIDFANVANGAIGTALIADAAISDAKILGVSANKLTAGTIDASNINVSNLRADTLIVNKLNGQPVFGGYVAVDSNGSGYHEKNPAQQGWYEISNGQMVLSQDTEVDDSKAYYSTSQSVALYDQSYIDGVESALNSRIDGAIETFSGSVVPTKQNYPYTDWYDTTTVPVTDNRAEHVGDLYYVLNENLDEDGWCYRFYYDNTTSDYDWVLIKDSDVTSALGRISDLETFETNTSSWIEETDDGLETIRTNHTTLSGTVDKTVKESVQLWYTKANATAPSKPNSQVTNNNQTGSNSYNKWNLAVPVYNASYPYYFFCWQFKLVDGTYAWSDVVYDQATSEAEERGRTGVSLANANIKSSVQLWFSKANTTKPDKPTSQITSTSTSGNAWRLVVPTYSSSYPYYYYCYQQQKGDGTYQWTDVVYDEATSTAMKKAQAALPTSTFETFETTTFKNVKDTVDEHSTTFTTYSEMTATDTSGATVTGITNIVNSVNSSTNSNSSKISSLESTTTSQGERLTSAETAIQQNANDITLRATKTEAYQVAQPNLTPYFLMPMTQKTDTYWDNISYTRFTQLEDGWAHFSYANSGSSTVNNYILPKVITTLTPGGRYTLLVEFRNVSISADGGNFYSQQNAYAQVWGTDSYGGFSISNAAIRALANGQGVFRKSLTLLTADSKDPSGTVRGSLPKTQFMSINQQVTAGQSVSYDLRLSLYEGEYTGPYKPYVGGNLYASQAELKVANDEINARVEKNGVISAINLSSESATIQASKVEIDGTAVFNAISSDVNSAITNRVNAIQVGGRNLLRENPASYAQNGYLVYNIPTEIALSELSVGDTLTFQFWDVQIDSNSSGIHIYWGGGSCSLHNSNLNPDAKGYCSLTYEVTSGHATHAHASNKFIHVYNFVNGHAGASCSISHWKMERGNKATDWTPAPEDQTAYVDSSRTWNATSTTAAGTAAKEATITPATTAFTLTTGVIVNVTFSNTNNAAAANLTLSVNGTAAKPIRYMYNTSRSTLPGNGYLVLGTVYTFLYDGEYWTIQNLHYNTNTNDTARYVQFYNTIVAGEALVAASLIGGHADGKFYQLSGSNDYFDLDKPLLWLTTALEANATNYANIFTQTYDRNLGTYYTSFSGGAANSIVYLVGTVSGNQFTLYGANSSTYLTCTAPTQADGRFYIPIGRLGNQSTGKNYFNFQVPYPVIMFAYVDGKFRQVTPTEIVATQRIYYRCSVSTATPDTAITKPSGWVTESGDKRAANLTTAVNWSLKKSAIAASTAAGQTKYLYLYTCEQRKRLDGTVDYTTVVIDDATTVIDGGNIITNSVTANEIAANAITADKLAANSLTLGKFTEDDKLLVDNSNVVVGGRNLLLGTKDWSTVSRSTVSGATYSFDGTHDGCDVLKLTTTTTNFADTSFINKFSVGIEPDTYYTLSFWAKASAAITIWSFWFNPNQIDSVVSSEGAATTRNDGGIQTTLTTSWKRYWITWHIKSGATTFPANVIVARLQQSASIWLAGCMFEKANKASSWSPAPEDQTAYVDSIQVGGRNYIFNSAGVNASCLGSADGSNKEYQTVNVGQSYMSIPHGTQVTISFDLYLVVKTANPRLQVYNTNNKCPKSISTNPNGSGSGPNVAIDFVAAVGTTIDQRISATCYVNDRPSPTLAYNVLEFYTNYGSNNFYSISNLKMEIGNKPTDWTPAPEDQQAYVTATAESINATIDTEVETLTGSITGVSNSLTTLGTKVDNLLTKATELEKKTQWVKWDDTEGMIFGENGTAFNTRLKAENMTFNYGNQTMMTLSATGGVDAPKVRTQRLELGSDWAITISGDMFAIDYIGS